MQSDEKFQMLYLMEYGVGSIGETARVFIEPLRDMDFNGTTDLNELITIYTVLCGKRANAAKIAGLNNWNRLYDCTVEENIRLFIKTPLKALYQGDTNSEEIRKWELDLPTFVLLAIFLESRTKRDAFKVSTQELNEFAFEVIYKTVLTP